MKGNFRRRGRVTAWDVAPRRFNSSSVGKPSNNSAVNETIEPPTRIQLRRVFLHAAVPMIGFGIMDQVRFVHIPVTFGRRSFG